MAQLRLVTRDGGTVELDGGQVDALQVRGTVLRPGDAGYEDARHVWNGMIDRQPGLVIRCAGVSDVIQAVNFARDNNLLTAVRSGGHSAAGTAVCDGGLVIDLSRMKGMRVDPANRTARAEAGLTWSDFDRETQAFGLATTGGVVSTTGISGLTLGGGIGWLMRTHGLTCDNVLSVDIVTVDGQLRRASAEENPDLFWAVRGGGGNFGVVTSFEYRLHPVGPMVLGGLLVWPRAMAADVLRRYREYVSQAPENASAYAALATSPEGAPVVVVVAFYHGDIQEGENLLRPLRDFGPPLADLVQPMPYTAFQQLLDPLNPPGNRVYWKSSVLRNLDDEVLDTLIEQTADTPSPLSATLIEFYGGAASRVPSDATAYPLRDALYAVNVISAWTDPSQDEANTTWTRRLWDAMQAFSSGNTYVNFLGVGDEGEQRVRSAYGANYDRLRAIKAKYDPDNLFRLNHNIPPAH